MGQKSNPFTESSDEDPLKGEARCFEPPPFIRPSMRSEADIDADDLGVRDMRAADDEPLWGAAQRPDMPFRRRTSTRSDTSWDVAAAAVRTNLGMYDVQDIVWQWEHRTGWRNYDFRQCLRIERAYQDGESHVRLKSGKAGKVPMEIFFADMVQFDPITERHRKVQRTGPDPVKMQIGRYIKGLYRAMTTGQPRKEVFATYARRRVEQLKKTIDEPAFNVVDLYSRTGCCAGIARSSAFFALVMLLVFANCLWIGIDAEFNKSVVITDADPGVQVIENLFCVAFFVEIVIRFVAFAERKLCFRDPWFVLDAVLVVCMVLEIWLLPLLYLLVQTGDSDEGASLGILRVARLLRLTRLGRIVRLLRLLPEVLTLLKGIGTAIKSVLFTMSLLGVIIYVFGIMFKHQAGTARGPLGKPLFETVPNAMWDLLLHGTFMDDVALFLNSLSEDSYLLAALFMVFILLSNYTIMNMVIGIICEVVAQVSRVEKEESAVAYLKHTLLDILECHDKDDDRHIHEDEFELLMRNPEIHFILTKFGVDVNDMVSLKEVLFDKGRPPAEDTGGSTLGSRSRSSVDSVGTLPSTISTTSCAVKRLSFGTFLELVLRLRGGNDAKVTDVVELRDFFRQRLRRIEAELPEDFRDTQGEDGAVAGGGRSGGPLPAQASQHGEAANGCGPLANVRPPMQDAADAGRRSVRFQLSRSVSNFLGDLGDLGGPEDFLDQPSIRPSETSVLSGALRKDPSNADDAACSRLRREAGNIANGHPTPPLLTVHEDDGLVAMLNELCEEQQQLREAIKDVRLELNDVLQAASLEPEPAEPVHSEALSLE